MRRFAVVCCAVLLMHGLFGGGRIASAATITSISYDITGGDFGSLYPGFSGPVTGVSITYTPPGGAIATPFTCAGSYACGQVDIHMTGPSLTATYSMWNVPLGTVLINPTKFLVNVAFYYTPYSRSTFWRIAATSGVGTGHTGIATHATASAITYVIGNEVRTTATPTPAPTPTPTPTDVPTPTPATATPPVSSPSTPTPATPTSGTPSPATATPRVSSPSTPTPATATSATATPPTATPTTGPVCAGVNPVTTINTIGKGQSPSNNQKLSHTITGNIIDPGSYRVTAHRIQVCASTTVEALVTDSSGVPANSAGGSLSCDPAGCSGVVNATEKYRSVSQDGSDKDSITLIPN